MNRRTFLATALAGGGAATAGCAGALGGTTTLSRPTEEVDDDGMEQYLRFEHAGERLAVVGLQQMAPQSSPTDSFRLRIHVEHRSGLADRGRRTTIDRFRFDLRAPPTSVQPPAEVYLQSPSGGLCPDFTFEQVENLWTRIAADGTSEVGRGTLTLSTIVDPLGLPADEIGVGMEIELSEPGVTGRAYVATAQTRFEPVVTQ